MLLYSILALLIIIADQVTKILVSGITSEIKLIPYVINIVYLENTGAAFSAFSDSTMLLSVFTLLMLIGVAVYMFFADGRIKNICTVCIFAGGAGNLIDRFAQGYVVDYIKTLFIDFPVFNFADILVV